MKTLTQILILAALGLSSCTSTLYTGAEYDDLYYLPSDKPIVKNKSSVNDQIAEGSLKSNDYYDNKYAADTLVSDQYSNAVDYNSSADNTYANDQGYEYYGDNSYTGRLRMFYGNYFDPFWRDPLYDGFGYGGYPYSYGYGYMDPYYGGMYSDYYGYGGYYPGYYSGFYGGLYGGYLGFGLYNRWSSYGGYAYGYGYRNVGEASVGYGRNERPSSMSSRWNSVVGGIGSSRRDTYSTSSTARVGGRTSGVQSATTDQRRVANTQQTVTKATGKSAQGNVVTSNTRTSPDSKPTYNSANRSYTPSYNNPRMSTRPSYNNSRVYNSSGATRSYSNQGTTYSNVRSSSSGPVQRRVESPSGGYAPANQYRSNSYRSSQSYSVPSRSSVERSSSSSSSGSSSYGSSRSSYSSGGGSYSSGSSSSSSSSSGSSSRSSGGGGSSSGRR